MKRKIFEQFDLKILSIVIAVAVWIIVANVDDYKTTKEISGIEIEFVNGDAITEKNKVYEVPEGTAVNIVVKGRRKIVEALGSNDFKAVADLSKMSVTNAVSVNVSAVNAAIGRELVISNTTDAVVIAVENKIERQMPVVVRAQSQVADGYAISNRTATPNLITVKGAESVVNAIEDVVVDVDVSGKSRNVTMKAPPIFLSKSGEVLDGSKFEYDVEQIETLVEILPTKEIRVKLNTTGSPAAGYMVSGMDYQPTTISVVGDSKYLSGLDEIVVGDIDITDANEDIETSVDILGYLPEGVTLGSDNSEIMVKVVIEKIVDRLIIFNPKDIGFVGENEEYIYTFTNNDDLKLSIRGLKDKLQRTSISRFMPSVNVTGLAPGKHEVKVIFKDVDGIEILSDITMEIEVKEKR